MPTLEERVRTLHQSILDEANSNLSAYYGKGVYNPGAESSIRGQVNLQQTNSLQGLNWALPYIQSGELTAEQMPLIEKMMRGDPIARERLEEQLSGQRQLTQQNKQLADFRTQREQQMFGGQGLSLSDALTSTGGDIGNLNRFLGAQEAETFNKQLKPLIQMALGAQGLSDSGAQVELQSKALAQLEQQRQQSMMQAALGGREQLAGIQRSDLLGGIGYAQQMQTNQFDLARTSITMQFQQQLEEKREQLARELSQRRGGGGGMGGVLGMGLGTVLGGAAGFALTGGTPQGALLGAGLGGGLGGAFGNYADPNENYGSISNVPGYFLAVGSTMNSRSQPKPQPYSGPMNRYGTPWQNTPGPNYSWFNGPSY